MGIDLDMSLIGLGSNPVSAAFEWGVFMFSANGCTPDWRIDPCNNHVFCLAESKGTYELTQAYWRSGAVGIDNPYNMRSRWFDSY